MGGNDYVPEVEHIAASNVSEYTSSSHIQIGNQWVTIPFDNAVSTSSSIVASGNQFVVISSEPKMFRISTEVEQHSSSNATRLIRILVNGVVTYAGVGTLPHASGTGWQTLATEEYITLAAGDTIEVQVYVQGGSNVYAAHAGADLRIVEVNSLPYAVSDDLGRTVVTSTEMMSLQR